MSVKSSYERKIKKERDDLLKESDWTQLMDSPLSDEKRQEWAVYRQALRDITEQVGYPFNVTFPTKPE